MRNRFALTLLILLITAGSLWSQLATLKKADQYFNQGEYRKSIPLYLKVLDEVDHAPSKINVAEAYRQIGDYETASQWYSLVVGLPESTPLHKLNYGLALLWKGDCETAERWFGEYLKFVPYDERKPQLMNACKYYNEIQNGNNNRITIENLPINSPVDDYAPALYRDGIVYTSSLNNQYTDLYFVKQDTNGYTDPTPFSTHLNRAEFHEAIASFDGEEAQVFFTRTRQVAERYRINGKNPLEITSGRLLPQGSWSELTPLPMSSDEYSVAHPSVSRDGKRLFFSSNMPGGFGGTDLYLTVYEDGQWGPIVNLGAGINTSGNEVFPHIGSDNRLYFSSDGYLGIGGQDIYWTIEDADGLWQRPQNLGAPINSNSDDFAIIFNKDGRSGMFTSNRDGGYGGDDIYAFLLKGQAVVLDVISKKTGNSIPNATVVNTTLLDTLQADENGRLLIYVDSCSVLEGLVDGFDIGAIEVCDEKGQSEDTLFMALALNLKVDYQFTGRIFDQESGKIIENALIEGNTSSSCMPLLPAYSGADGAFNIPLKAACCYTFTISKEGYQQFQLTSPICTNESSEITIRDIALEPVLGEIPPEENPAHDASFKALEEEIIGFEKSQDKETKEELYLLNVYYEVGRSSVNSGSVSELMRLLGLLREKDNISIEIRSHTDSNGSDEANLRLSQRRADAIVRFLVKSGIDRDRLIAKGYGESRPVNGCTDGIPCTEIEYQENRRTEFKVMSNVN
ncbi:MAG: OmpA family protein [Chitinophagales bacterium]|nr:OmpA family protein [Chitinophagales bacterium]